jgi:hypothetical protein
MQAPLMQAPLMQARMRCFHVVPPYTASLVLVCQ